MVRPFPEFFTDALRHASSILKRELAFSERVRRAHAFEAIVLGDVQEKAKGMVPVRVDLVDVGLIFSVLRFINAPLEHLNDEVRRQDLGQGMLAQPVRGAKTVELKGEFDTLD